MSMKISSLIFVSSFTISRDPYVHARCNGVYPLSFLEFSSA